MREEDREKEKAEQLCYICLHQRMLIGTEPLIKDNHEPFPVEPYCSKEHSKLSFDCVDFEPDKEKVRHLFSDMIDCRELDLNSNI